MASYKTAFGSFLKTEDLQGRQIRVTIESVDLEEVKGEHGMEKKLVARFAGKDKGLILNMTNCETIESIAGSDDYEQWPGTALVLYPTTTKFGNKTVPCLRIRSAAGNGVVRQAAPPPPPPEEFVNEIDDSDIPFAWLLPMVLPALGLLSSGVLA
jgi:hypothetical protein